jgi:molybdate transport system ATP-binding protein
MSISLDMSLTRGAFEARFTADIDNGITGVFGKSGCGKTTFLHLICGLLKPDNGRLTVFDRKLVNTKIGLFVRPEKRGVGIVFQDLRLFPHLTVEKNLLFSVPRGHHPPMFDKLVRLLDIDTLLHRKPDSLSGGEKQRAAIGRALLQSPRVLLLDEPFSAIDGDLRYQILPYLRRIQSLLTIPILVVSHELVDILMLTDRLLIIRDGRVIANDSLFNLIREPEIYPILRRHRLTNRLHLQYESRSENGSLRLRLPPGPSSVVTEAATVIVSDFEEHEALQTADRIPVFLSPSAVALSDCKSSHISQNNQIPGVITDIIDCGHNTLCIVDIGEKILVEITKDSCLRLALAPGAAVYCLFKSNSVSLIPDMPDHLDGTTSMKEEVLASQT